MRGGRLLHPLEVPHRRLQAQAGARNSPYLGKYCLLALYNLEVNLHYTDQSNWTLYREPTVPAMLL